jgi:hypothetical protein
MAFRMEQRENNREYCRRRAAEELAAANYAADERAAQSHRDLARHFEELAGNLPENGAPEGAVLPASTLPSEFRIIP